MLRCSCLRTLGQDAKVNVVGLETVKDLNAVVTEERGKSPFRPRPRSPAPKMPAGPEKSAASARGTYGSLKCVDKLNI